MRTLISCRRGETRDDQFNNFKGKAIEGAHAVEAERKEELEGQAEIEADLDEEENQSREA